MRRLIRSLPAPGRMLSGLALAGALGCAHAPVRGDARVYADALASGDLPAAYAMTSPDYRSRVSQAQYLAAHADPAERAQEAERLRAVTAQLDAVAPELAGAPDPELAAARRALSAFLTAAEGRHFADAYAWLSSDLRARYTPSSLARDFSLAPDAGDRLRRAQAAARGPAVREGRSILFPIAQGKAVRLVEEADGFRVAALE